MSNNTSQEDLTNLANLQENFNKQQAKITALKELVRKSEEVHGRSTSSAQEKVKSIAQRLTHLKSKARSRQHLERSFSEFRDATIIEESSQQHQQSLEHKRRSETPGSEKIQLLREQMEKNKLKIAERENNKREIEELVTQLKAKMDSTQQSLERSSELGRSMGDLTNLTSIPISSKYKSATDLSFAPLNLDKERIKFLENRIRILEKQLEKEKSIPKAEGEFEKKVEELENKILDLEENIKEKDCIIEARTQAVSLMSESLSAKGKNTVDMLEETKQEMFKMQTNFLETEDNLKEEIQTLKADLEEKSVKISNLEEVNEILENARFDLTIKNAELESKIQDVQDYITKISELNKLNETLQRRIADLENQKSEHNKESDVTEKIGGEYINKIQSLQDRIAELEKENDDLKKLAQDIQGTTGDENSDYHIEEKIKALENTIEVQKEEINNHVSKILQLEEQLTEKTIEYNVVNANFSVLQEKIKASTPKSLFPKSTDEETELEINKLKTQLDDSNKSMIKMKLKIKQLQKQVDAFKKISDVHAELIKLEEENQQLQQKIVELEEEQGQLQLKVISGDLGETNDSELEKKIQILETTCQNQTSAIQLLEEQKLDMTESLQCTKHELETLKDQMNEIDREETARVVSQIESIQLEEKANIFYSEIQELKNEIELYKSENKTLTETMQKLQQDKEELNKKINHYVAENMELLDKIEKLSKSSSSAESIEIVERLTQQEKLEIEAFNKRMDQEHTEGTQTSDSNLADDTDNLGMGQELSESLTKLREESSELMHKIELFTTERREVLEKMEILTNENQEYIKRVKELSDEKSDVETKLSSIKTERDNLEKDYGVLQKQKSELLQQIDEVNKERLVLNDEINLLKKEKESVKVFCKKGDLIEDCKKTLKRLSSEIKKYYDTKDESNKLNSSKKLAKEAKNTYQKFNEFLDNLTTNIDASTSSSANKDEHKSVIEEFKKNLDESNSLVQQKDQEIDSLTTELNEMKKISENFDKILKDKEVAYEEEIQRLEELRREMESKCSTAEKEIIILKTLVAEQKQQLIESYKDYEAGMETKVQEIQNYETKMENLKIEMKKLQNEKINSYETYTSKLNEDIKELEKALNDSKKLANQYADEVSKKQETIDSLNGRMNELIRTVEENVEMLSNKEEEVSYFRDLILKNERFLQELNYKNENLQAEINSLKKKLSQLDLLNNIKEQNRTLQGRINELERINTETERKNKDQMDKLKKFAANLKKKVAQCTELENKIKELESGSQEINNSKVDEQTLILEKEIEKYKKEIECLKSVFEKEVKSLRNELEDLNKERDFLKQQLSDKKSLLEQYEGRTQTYLIQIEQTTRQLSELQTLVEKLHLDFEEKNKTERHLLEKSEIYEKQIEEKDEKIKTLLDDLHNKNLKFEKSKAVIKEKNREIQRLINEKDNLTQELNDLKIRKDVIGVSDKELGVLQEENKKLKEDYNNLQIKYNQEKVNFEETISRLETLHDEIQAKLQQDMIYIESLESENNKYKMKIDKLENCVQLFEDRKSSLEQCAHLLDIQWQKKVNEYEMNEDVLAYRIEMLIEHDDIIGRRLLETHEEKEELLEKFEHLKQEHNELMQKFVKIEKEYELYQREKYQNLEFENQSMRNEINQLNNNLTKLKSNYESQLANKQKEVEDLENDLSIQLRDINIEKRNLQENLERCKDELQLIKEENNKLKEDIKTLEQIKSGLETDTAWLRVQHENLSQNQFELQELRMQIMQDKTEIENQKHHIDTLIQNHDIELCALRTQIAELDSMRMQVGQNQTDDQVFIETENKKLKELLAEKESIIENYQRQNLQLQMTALASSAPDPFGSLSSEPSTSHSNENNELTSVTKRCKELEQEVSELKEKIHDQEVHNENITFELTSMQHCVVEKQHEIDSLKGELERFYNNQQETTSVFATEQALSTVFDEIVTRREIETIESEVRGVKDQKKIEDLQRNVSDLEKYAADLENKLKHLTAIHEETVRQLQQKTSILEKFDKNTTTRIKELEEKERELTARKSIDSTIWEDNAQTTLPLNIFLDYNDQESTNFDPFSNESNSRVPVQEEIIVPKRAYLCGPHLEAEPKIEMNEGWGWGSEETPIEEKYLDPSEKTITSLIPLERRLEIKVQEHEDRIKELELERDRLEEQKLELQVKSGKMMKKLKEYKNTIAQLTSKGSFRKSSSIESNDLDLAIQEEFQSQIHQLEEKLKEMKKNVEKEAIEKENLQKQVDMLTLANERFTEMKERQDIEVEMYQAKVRQLNQQLKSLEDWSDQPKQGIPDQSKKVEHSTEKSSDNEELKRKYEEVLHELEDTKIDRDELHALLNDEKECVKQLEEKIKNLQTKIASLEDSIAKSNEGTKNTEVEYQAMRSELSELKLKNQNLQIQLSDYQSTIEQLSAESNSIKTHLDTMRTEHERKVEENTKLAKELEQWVEKSNNLSREIEAMKVEDKNRTETLENLKEYEQKVQELNAQLQYKDAELVQLNQQIEKIMKEDQTQSLIHEILAKNVELNQLRQSVKDLEQEKLELENNLSMQFRKDLDERKLSQNEQEELQEKISSLEKCVEELKSEKSNMEKELEELNNHVINSLEMEDKMKQTVLELDMKNIEISELKQSLEVLKSQNNENNQTNQNVNSELESVIEQRCGEIAENWRQYLAQKEVEFKQQEDNLRKELEEWKSKAVGEKSTTESENNEQDSEIILKMQTALESQELEIVTLKEQLAMRSAEYARLAAQHDPYAQTTTSSYDAKLSRRLLINEQAHVVPKSKLDLALYMLHQRDMKCEELALELKNLLAERDTLQLKLSNSLRQIEEIKVRTRYSESLESDQGTPSNASSPEKTKSRVISVNNDVDISEDGSLNQKLSQLHTVNYSIDKRLWEERDQRQRPMEKIQQDVANIPPEAVSELVGSDLSSTTQSPSAVLLNWLFGKTSTTDNNQ